MKAKTRYANISGITHDMIEIPTAICMKLSTTARSKQCLQAIATTYEYIKRCNMAAKLEIFHSEFRKIKTYGYNCRFT